MLVLSRRNREKVLLKDSSGQLITVEVVDVRGDRVRLGFTAPDSVRIFREEVVLTHPPIAELFKKP